jgi:hypothetical protein
MLGYIYIYITNNNIWEGEQASALMGIHVFFVFFFFRARSWEQTRNISEAPLSAKKNG